MGPLKTAKMARKGVQIENGRVSRWEDPFFRIPHVLNGLEPPIRPPNGVGAVAVEGGENGPLIGLELYRVRIGVGLGL